MVRLFSQFQLGLIMALHAVNLMGGDVKISAVPVARIDWRLIKDEKVAIPENARPNVEAIREHMRAVDFSQWLQRHFFPEKSSQYAHFNPGVGFKSYTIDFKPSNEFFYKSKTEIFHYYTKEHKFIGGFTPYYAFNGKGWFSGWKIDGHMFSDLIYPFEVGNHFLFIWGKLGEVDHYKQTKNLVILNKTNGRVIVDKILDFWPGKDWGFPIESEGIGLPFYKNNRIYFQAVLMSSYDDLKKPIEDRLSDIVVLELTGLETQP